MICKICNEKCKSIRALAQHIRFKHSLTNKDYYDLFNDKGICEECANPTKFLDLTRGYQKFCSLKCSNNNNIRIQKFKESYLLNDIDEIKRKRKETNVKKYGNEIANRSQKIKEKQSESFRRNQTSKLISYLDKFKIKIISGTYLNYNSVLLFKCEICGSEFEETAFNVCQRIYKCKCSIPHSRSRNEIELEKFVKSILPNENLLTNYKVDKYEIDILIPDKKIAFEYNGLYWHSELILKEPTMYHYNKVNTCIDKGFSLIQIFEDEWLEKNDIVKHRIQHILGLDNNQKIYARKCEIKEIDCNSKNDFLNRFHLQGKDISKINLGAFYNNKLISVMTFSKGNISKGSVAKDDIWELSRFCSDYNYSVIGIAGKLFHYFMNNYKWKQIFSYADRRWSNGNLYYKLGFNLEHITKPNYWYTKNGFKRIHRFNLRKREKDNPNIPEWILRRDEGYYRIWDAGNYKFTMENNKKLEQNKK